LRRTGATEIGESGAPGTSQARRLGRVTRYTGGRNSNPASSVVAAVAGRTISNPQTSSSTTSIRQPISHRAHSHDEIPTAPYGSVFMSSPEHAFRDSSPAEAVASRRSQFTYRHLSQMAAYNTSCPLRVVAHIDLDCFYAQAEMVRLGVAEDRPLAVQQWFVCRVLLAPAFCDFSLPRD
jgi:hypothetical protein